MITASTRMLGVLGWPVAHSLSPAMQGAALAALGLDWSYGAFAVPPERLAEAVRGAEALGFVGVNLTIPHKEAALALCVPDEESAKVGAVNTLIFQPGAPPRGENSDVHGFRLLLHELGVVPKKVALLGAGGAARAVAHALLAANAEVIVVSRSERRLTLAGKDLPHVPWDPPSLAQLFPTIDLLVDTTPRGLASSASESIDLSTLPDHASVVDLAVRPSTPLIGEARARGLRSATGTTMLLHQGARALESWTGRPAPVDVMREALVKALVG